MAPVNLRDMLMPAVETAARRASVPVAIRLDHGTIMESALERLRSLHRQPLPDKIAALKAQGWH